MANGLSYATHVNSLLWHKVFLTGGRSVIHHGCWRTQYAVHMSKYMKSWDDLSPNNLQSSYPNEFQRITINHILLIIRNYPPFTSIKFLGCLCIRISFCFVFDTCVYISVVLIALCPSIRCM